MPAYAGDFARGHPTDAAPSKQRTKLHHQPPSKHQQRGMHMKGKGSGNPTDAVSAPPPQLPLPVHRLYSESFSGLLGECCATVACVFGLLGSQVEGRCLRTQGTLPEDIPQTPRPTSNEQRCTSSRPASTSRGACTRRARATAAGARTAPARALTTQASEWGARGER